MAKQTTLFQHELLSDDVQDVISYRPHWIVRKGNSLFFLIILLLLTFTGFIKYPDTVSGSARLVALNPPKLVSSKEEGKLLKLFVVNEQQAHKDQHLGYMESTAEYSQVMKLQSWVSKTISETRDNHYEILISNLLPQLSDLGELQSGYQVFQNQLTEIKQTLANGYYQKKRNALEKDLQYQATLRNNANEQQKLLEQDQQLQTTEYKAYESLAKDKVIAPLELNQYKSKLIAKDQNLKQIGVQITNNDIITHNKEKELLDLQKTVIDQQQQFHSALLDMKSQIDKWIQQYVLIAPEDGKVLFVSSLQENELVTNGQSLFYIQPEQTKIYVELMMPQNRLGKIRTGQKVLIKVESYPSSEFGYLTGIITYISSMPNLGDSFLIKVNLTNGLQTNFGKTIFFRNNLSASAEVITDNRRLLDRLLGNLKQAVK